MTERRFLAFDLGAESGRAILGALKDGRVALREIHRFPNGPVFEGPRLHWDVPSLVGEIKKGLTACAGEGPAPDSVAVDTWGVDFGLLDAAGRLLGLPFAYRDARNIAAMEGFLRRVPGEKVYERTGIQFLPFNSLFQLEALARENPDLLRAADRLLFMPDLLTYFLCGSKINEASIASTSQLIDPRTRTWAADLFEAVGAPASLVRRPLEPGLAVGRLLPSLTRETGLGETIVVATASHDTASAVAAVPAEGRDWAYISSGTWSLMGIESDAPVIGPESRRLNFTNEGGMAGSIRLLKNIAGLWLVQQCRKAWSGKAQVSYDELTAWAAAAPPFGAFVDPDAAEFLNPPDMPEAIRAFGRRTGQKPPMEPGAVVRCALESLALKYRRVLAELRRIAPGPINKIHVIGGGSRNALLCRMTADATGLPVAAGPAEATALGNIMGQALALGDVRSVADMRRMIAASTDIVHYGPRDTAAWDKAASRFAEIIK